MLRRSALFAALTVLIALTPPAYAQSGGEPGRQAAEAALEHVEELIADPAAYDPHALTPALTDLARQKSELDTADRRRARAILARPPENTSPGGWTPAEAADATSGCTTHFCFHWVDDAAEDDAPDLTDADANGRPDYVDLVARSFEQAYATEVGSLRWRAPVSDGTLGGNSLVDVYLSDIAPTYGYAVPEGVARSTYGYLVIDNDYAGFGYPGPTIPVQVTAAHEFNHVLQYAYDADQDTWMFEATATWAEDKVFDADNDYVNYMDAWAGLPEQPITSAGSGQPTGLKMYGSAIWNHWLERRYTAQVVRQAWAVSRANSDLTTGYGFAPLAYDRAIKDYCGPGFSYEFEDFTASTAEWQAPNSGIHEGASFAPLRVERAGSITVDDATGVSGFVDHTAFALYDVQSPPTGPLHLTGSLPSGTPGSIALVGRKSDGTMVKSLGILNANGRGVVTLDAGPYDGVTAVVTNADWSQSAFSGSDWVWSKNHQAYTLKATTADPNEPAAAAPPSFTPCPPTDPEPTPTPTPTATATPSATATPTPTPTVRPPVATTIRLSRSSTRIPSVLRKGVLSLFAQANKAGRYTAKATVDAKTAKRLKVGRRTTSAGTGRRTATAPARLKVNVKLTRKLRAALKRNRKRSVKISVAVTFVPADGTSAVRKAITIKLKP